MWDSFPVFCILLGFLTCWYFGPPRSGLGSIQTSKVTAADTAQLSLDLVLLGHKGGPTIGKSAWNSLLPPLIPRSGRDFLSPLWKFLLSRLLGGPLLQAPVISPLLPSLLLPLMPHLYKDNHQSVSTRNFSLKLQANYLAVSNIPT